MSDEEYNDTTREVEDSLPSVQDFYTKIPLYKSYEFDASNAGRILYLEYCEGTIDTYCAGCGRHSVFKGTNSASSGLYQTEQYALSDRTFSVRFGCTRDTSSNKDHTLSFYFRVSQSKIMKIGQWPSIADLQFEQINKYKKLLGNEAHRELKKAIGLVSHGIGIGAFVYLRRIFENLIEEAHQQALKPEGWNEEQFIKSRMDEKILLLKDYLPSFLVETRRLYSILSKGIHSLTEEECLSYFAPIRVGIELILDEKIKQEEKRNKEDEARRLLASIENELH
jgi:hypothetical protein